MPAVTAYPSIEKPWLKHYTKEALAMPLPECTVDSYIRQNNQDDLHGTALSYYGTKISFGQLFEQVDRTAQALLASGVKKGDCISLCVAGTPEVICLVLACSQIGAVAAFINPLFSTNHMVGRIQESESRLLFVLDVLYPRVREAIPDIGASEVIIIPVNQSMPACSGRWHSLKKRKVQIPKQHTPWSVFMKRAQQSLPLPTGITGDLPLLTVYSSGSTGTPKGILYTNRGINASNAHYIHTNFPYRRGHCFFQIVPVWFSTGIVVSVLNQLSMGNTVILEPAFSLDNFAKGLAKHKPNLTLIATSSWVNAMGHPALQKADLSSLIYPITGGERLLPRTEEAINRFLQQRGCKAPLIKGWGMCELGGTTTKSEIHHSKPGSSGFPVLHVVVSAFDIRTDKELRYGQRGELRVVSPSSLNQYYKNPEATAAFFKTDGQGITWACTGDIGFVDEDGDVFVQGRASDAYTATDGSIQYCFDAEEVVLRDVAITNCKVMGVQVAGHIKPVCHLILSDKQLTPIPELLHRLDTACKKHLPQAAVPVAYKLREALPILLGKLDRKMLEAERDGFVDADNCPLPLH